ncbi:MAG: gamma carbonic anhydrase family protein [Woeseia sp.]|nr:gamma carbonic anhydrase family protein [Woeseia sp.]MBT8097710.1 gamma carbonic anhydrase family protein [Woeseia sp.]NNE59980.1 gamma carbonic anhydrase family protein [Woeseia sp.]NNL55555.1 gamma carbonic anhydrase family protein [Woeseia sp.]
MIFALGDSKPELDLTANFVAPNATVIGKVRMGAGASVWFGAVIRGDNDWISIGRNCNIQDGAILHTDPGIPLTLGDEVTVGHRAMLHGCNIGDGSLVGIGSTVLNHARIGRHCIIGAHSLVTEGKEFPDGVLILGSPARIVRELTTDERQLLAASAAVYIKNSERYRNDLEALDA